MRKLNLGAGNTEIEGYENIDRKTGQEVYPLELMRNGLMLMPLINAYNQEQEGK